MPWEEIADLTKRISKGKERLRLLKIRTGSVAGGIRTAYGRSRYSTSCVEADAVTIADAEAVISAMERQLEALRDQVRPAIETLPTRLREPMELRYLQGQSIQAISFKVLYCDRQVKRLLQEARELLKGEKYA